MTAKNHTKTSKKWFLLDEHGAHHGPYSEEEIISKLTSNQIKLESKVFEAESNTWKTAADLIPSIGESVAFQNDQTPPPYSVSEPSVSMLWNTPKKPTEFKNLHVVDLNQDPTDGVDYFALLNQFKRDQVKKEPTSQPDRQPLASKTPSSNAVKEDATSFTELPSILKNIYLTHKKIVMGACAAGFIFVGIIGVLRTLNQSNDRKIAEQTTSSEKMVRSKNKVSVPKASESYSGIGTGKNTVQRKKPVSRLNLNEMNRVADRQNQNEIQPPSNPNNDRESNEQAQLVTTSEPEIMPSPDQMGAQPMIGEAGIAPTYVPPQNQPVEAPGFVDPNINSQFNAGIAEDPMRQPTSDPNIPVVNPETGLPPEQSQ